MASPRSGFSAILFVCTANRCRSPMAAGLLEAALRDRGLTSVEVCSAGLLSGGEPAPDAARELVPTLDGYISRQLTSSLVDDADLIVGMARSHVREVTVLVPKAFPRTFTLKELVRCAPVRAGDEAFDTWVRRVGADRSPSAMLGDSDEDDIPDPIGQPIDQFRVTAEELRSLIAGLVDRAWPPSSAES